MAARRSATTGDENDPRGKKYLIHDRDPLLTAKFLEMLAGTGVATAKLPPGSPNWNAYAERSVRSIKESCLDRAIWFGEGALRRAVQDFLAHYHREINHQGLENRLIEAEDGDYLQAYLYQSVSWL